MTLWGHLGVGGAEALPCGLPVLCVCKEHFLGPRLPADEAGEAGAPPAAAAAVVLSLFLAAAAAAAAAVAALVV